MDPKLKNELEQTKAQFDEILKQTEQEIHILNSDLRTLEDEAAKLHKQRVRVASLFLVLYYLCGLKIKRCSCFRVSWLKRTHSGYSLHLKTPSLKGGGSRRRGFMRAFSRSWHLFNNKMNFNK